MRRHLLWLGAAGLLAGSACQGPLSTTRYIPPEDCARQALEAALQAWHEGQQAPLQVGPVGVQFVDSHRRPGQRLCRYVVLGTAPGDAQRCFAVRLSLENPNEEVRARYVVFGIDPLWVYRHEDYEMLSHWMCETNDTRSTSAKS